MTPKNQPEPIGFCPECGNVRYQNTTSCPICGYVFVDEKIQVSHCPHCGANYYEGDVTCSACGRSLTSVAEDSTGKNRALMVLSIVLSIAAVVLCVLIFLKLRQPVYEVVLGEVSFNQAKAESKEKGGSLASPQNASEMDNLLRLLDGKGVDNVKLYVGLEYVKSFGNYYWVDKEDALQSEAANSDSSWTWKYWTSAPGTANGECCAVLEKKSGEWKLSSSDGKETGSVGYIVSY